MLLEKMESSPQIELSKEVNTEVSETRKLINQIMFIITNITVEPVIFLTMFCSTIYQIIAQNLYLEKACRVNIGFNSSICDAMALRNDSGYSKSQEVQVQKMVSDMLALRTAILSFFPICLIIFIGSWSDRYNRRKPFILAPIAGEIVCCVSLILNVVFFYELPLIVTVLGDSLPLAILGGWPCLFIGIYTYVGVRCSDENRSLRMGAVSAAKMGAHSLGFSVAGLIAGAFGFIGFFSICILILVTALCLGVFLVKEDKVVRKSEKGRGILLEFFSTEYFKNTVKICFNKEPNNRRFKFIIIMLLSVIVAGPVNGEFNVNYMNARYRFGWNAVQFGLYFSMNVVIEVFGCILGVVIFSKILHLNESLLGVIGFTCSILANIIFALAPQEQYYYLGAVFDMFRMVPYIGMRSLMSRIVPHHELGQSNSMFGLSESFMPFIFGPLYSTIYKFTIEVLPGTFFLVSAFMKLIGICLFLCLYLETKRQRITKENTPSLSPTKIHQHNTVL